MRAYASVMRVPATGPGADAAAGAEASRAGSGSLRTQPQAISATSRKARERGTVLLLSASSVRRVAERRQEQWHVVVLRVVTHLEHHAHLGVEAGHAARGEVRAGREREPVAPRAVQLRERVL